MINIRNWITNGGGIPVVIEDIYANLPPAGIPGRLFVTTDQTPNIIYRDTGTAWVVLFTGGAAGTLTNANNGLSVSGGNTAQLGGTLIKTTDIDPTASGFQLSVNGAAAINNAVFILNKLVILLGTVDNSGTVTAIYMTGGALNFRTQNGATITYLFTVTATGMLVAGL